MRKLFRIYAAQGGHSAELELPATDHELLDLMERLRLGPGQSPYLAIQEYLEPNYSYDYLSGYIQNPPGLMIAAQIDFHYTGPPICGPCSCWYCSAGSSRNSSSSVKAPW